MSVIAILQLLIVYNWTVDPHWVNLCEREPAENQQVQVIVVHVSGGGADDMEYESATLTSRGWRFNGTPRFTRVVAWLEADRALDRKELVRVPKDALRF